MVPTVSQARHNERDLRKTSSLVEGFQVGGERAKALARFLHATVFAAF